MGAAAPTAAVPAPHAQPLALCIQQLANVGQVGGLVHAARLQLQCRNTQQRRWQRRRGGAVYPACSRERCGGSQLIRGRILFTVTQMVLRGSRLRD